jgi:hypothetical protein
MRPRAARKFHPELERFEKRQLLSAGSLTTNLATLENTSKSPASPSEAKTGTAGAAAKETNHSGRVLARAQGTGKPSGENVFLAFRVTNTPHQLRYKLVPPFQQVLVQSLPPVPGQVYNVLYIALKNGTKRTFDSSAGFLVRVPNGKPFPVLTGNEQWRPGQVIVFYVLTKKYYPMSFVSGGFQFDLGGASSTLIPGPSGIFLRLKYDPAKFARTLDWIVAYGQGNQLGQGAKFGLPNTAINAFVSARTHRIDFGGRF